MHFLTITDFDANELQQILDQSQALYAKNVSDPLKGKNILFAFEKPSLRTKVGTEVAINKLGGSVIHVEAPSFFGGKILHAAGHDPSGKREDLKDTMKNVNQWCDAVFARVFDHQTLQTLAQHSEVPIINALCDQHHPMQALADFLTIQQVFGKHSKPTITFVGDRNNVAYSLIEMGLKLGYPMQFTGPKNYYWSGAQLQYFEKLAQESNTNFKHHIDPKDILPGSDVIYSDTFVSMGEEAEYDEKIKTFTPYQVNKTLIDLTGKTTYFMHCLPAHRGIEVTDEVIDSPTSLVYQQAKNRMVSSLGVFHHFLKPE